MKNLNIEYNLSEYRLKGYIDETGEYELTGACNRCGECCRIFSDASGYCKYRVYETLDGVVQYRCDLPYQTRPMACLLWPSCQEDAELFSGCTINFIKK